MLKMRVGEKKRETNLDPKSTKGIRVIEMGSILARPKS